MDVSTKAERKTKRGVGRPRRLTLEAIVDAACELGLAKLEMHLVAERLNTGVATLYGYVRGREQLEQLVIQRIASYAMVGETAATWQDVLRQHAELSVRTSEAIPHILTNLINGEPDEQENAYAGRVIDKLTDCGLTRDDAIVLYIESTQAVIGAAICRVRAKRMIERDPNFAAVKSDALGDYRPTLERIIRDHERALSGQSE